MVKDKLSQQQKKKLYKITMGIAGVLLLALISGVIIHGKNSENSKSEMTVQDAQVEKILVENGDEVTKGQKLATVNEASVAKLLLEVKENIEDTEDAIDDLSSDAKVSGTTEYLEAKVLNGTLADLEDTEETLEKLLKKKAITASCDGVISDIYVTADTEVEQSSDTTNADNVSQNGVSANSSASVDVPVNDVVKVSVKTQESQIMFLSTAENDNAEVMIKDCSIDVAAPVTGEKPQSELGDSDYFTGTISWNCSTDTFQENTVYTATIKLTAKEGYVFSKNILPEVKGADVTSEVLESDAGESILKIKAQFAKTGKATADSSDENQSVDSASQNTGNSTSENSANAASGSANSNSGTFKLPQVSGESVSAQAKASGGSVSGSSSAGNSASSGSSSSDEDNVSMTTAFSIASRNQAAVSIQVDEMDINSVKEGQSATITLDALEGETFEGTITNVSSVASSSGNSVKYPVDIVMDKTENMLLGMSASATICVEESEDAVLIPVNALQERGNKTFVYTEKDSEGNLSGETEVETGLSNESRVEILSGLNEGDTVYYLKVGSGQSDMSGMKQWGGQRPGNGEMPGGGMPNGDMPSGNKPGMEDRQ